MRELAASVVSVHSGDHEDLHKDPHGSVEVGAEGFPGDKHRGFTRVAWRGDKDPEGTVRRNERQWSDLPGHGASSKQLENGRLAEFTATLAAFMDAISAPKAHLVGHSMGGAIALDLALTHPDRALSLVLLAPAGLGPEIDNGYIEGFITARRRRDLKPHIEKLFADPSAVSRQLVDDILKYKRIDGVDSALRAIAATLFPEGRQAIVFRDRLTELSVPTTILWGSDDRILSAAHAQGLPANVVTHILPGKGHMVQMEAAAEVNQSIVACWDRSPA